MFGLEHSCEIWRVTPIGTNGRESRQLLLSGVACLALPMDPRSAVQNGYSVGKGWELFFDAGQDVKVGDQVRVNGRKYNVSGVMPYEVPVVGHVRTVCTQEGL